MTKDLDGIAAKIQRADQHIAYLDTEIARILRDDYRIESKFNVQTRQYVFTAFGEPFLAPRIAVVVGEVVHQLRSSLDHVITRLNAIGPGGGKPERLEFPVCRTPDQFKEASSRGKIYGVSPAAAKAIEELQPYWNGRDVDSSTLWQLHDLDRTDKHRLLLVVAAAVNMAKHIGIHASMDVTMTGMTPPNKIAGRPGKDGAEIFAVDFVESDPEMKMNADFAFRVAFGQAGVLKDLPMLPVLIQMRDYVVRTIKANFFPGFKV